MKTYGKQITRQEFVDEFKNRVTNIMEEIVASKKRMLPQLKMLHSFKDLKFADTYKGDERERKVEKRSKKTREKYEKFLEYEKKEIYAKLLREMISKLRDEDDSLEWKRIAQPYFSELNKIRGDMHTAYYEFLGEFKDLIIFIKEQKREEMKEMDALEDKIDKSDKTIKEGVDFMETTKVFKYSDHRDEIVHMLYEKCSSGEITLEQREATINRLNSYCELTTENMCEAVNSAIESYISEKSTEEEMDFVLDKIYEESPELSVLFSGSDIDERYERVRRSILSMYENEDVTKEDLPDLVNLMESAYEYEEEHRNTVLYGTTGEIEMLESALSNGDDKYYEMMESYYTIKENVEEMLANGKLTKEEAELEIDKMTVSLYTMFAEATESTVKKSILDKTVDALKSIIATALYELTSKSKKAKDLIIGYESINKDTIGTKFSDLKVKKFSLSYVADKFYPDLKQLLMRDAGLVGKAFVAYKNGKEFAICGLYSSQSTGYTSYGGNGAVTITSTKPTLFYKSLSPEAKRHEDYYRAVLALKYNKIMTPEIKDFAREFLKVTKDLQAKEKEALKAKKKEEKGKTKSVKIVKECAGDNTYEESVKEIYNRYYAGEIDIEKREELLMEAVHNTYLTQE